MAAKQLLVLELNEVNFGALSSYAKKGLLPNFSAFFDRHGYSETTSEERYDQLEPWIQWVTAHTGLTLSEHGVFRLGDIVKTDIEQIWERLASHGISVGAVSPMNAKCRGDKWDFFLPDPWTPTEVVAEPVVKRLFAAIAQVVNDNAQERVAASSMMHLGIGALLNAMPNNYLTYISYLAEIIKKPWFKAIMLDQLLADLFIRLTAKHSTQFATLFLNAGAHIQHHYMFSSAVYDGPMRNPSWYVIDKYDPVQDVYVAYDHILGNVVRRFGNARIMLATGLHQDPHPQLTYYWRLKNHEMFLKKIGVDFVRVEPRMSRDFVIYCDGTVSAKKTAHLLESATTDSGDLLFEIDNRGTDLFVTLSINKDLKKVDHFFVNEQLFGGLSEDVAFVAIKNGQHNGIGYFADSGVLKQDVENSFPLTNIPKRVFDSYGIEL